MPARAWPSSSATSQNPRDRREARPDVLDTPVHPGSIVKAVALVAALESGSVLATSSHLCRRVATVDGQRFECAHPDLKRPLSPAEALAYSCNDFFVSLAPRLSREALNRARTSAGLPPMARVHAAGARHRRASTAQRRRPARSSTCWRGWPAAGPDTPAAMRPDTRAVLMEGLRGAAQYGTASAFKAGGVAALAKTGTIPCRAAPPWAWWWRSPPPTAPRAASSSPPPAARASTPPQSPWTS